MNIFRYIRFNLRKPKLLVLLGLSLTLVACGDQSSELEVPLRPVRTMVVSEDTASSLRTFAGVSRSAQESRLSFKVAGTVTEIPVTVGDNIKAGTVIARIDSSTYELQRQQAQATVAQSNAAARNARAAYERTRGLYANNNVSLGELESTRANSDSAAAQLRAANKSLQLAELNLSYTELTVDVDCTVDSISVSENENVTAGSAVARVNCSDELEIEVAVPESVIGDFKRGKTADVEFDAIPNNAFKGIVVEVGVDEEGVGSTFPITVMVTDQHPSIRTGLAASVSFVTAQENDDEHILPLSSIVRKSEGTFVFIVEAETNSSSTDQGAEEASSEDNASLTDQAAISSKQAIGVVALRKVELGDLETSGIKVVTGLAAGDRVVVAGVSFLRDGLRVLY